MQGKIGRDGDFEMGWRKMNKTMNTREARANVQLDFAVKLS